MDQCTESTNHRLPDLSYQVLKGVSQKIIKRLLILPAQDCINMVTVRSVINKNRDF